LWCKIGTLFAPNVPFPSAQKSFGRTPLGEEAQVEVIQDGCTVCVEHTIGLEIALDAPDGTLSRCASCGISVLSLETVLLSVQDSARFVPNVPLAQKSFWTHPMVLLGDEAQVKARSVWRQC
jgi:hypothetical protein